ncbi:DUF7147 family protein [Salsuginibacillus kocurii]|uniref:DUF7147 family protein n=1 Tax=Salsuginibacillus kocurii TaxID=427078 RepID=UPI00036FA0E6|nr:hypothetical protein [Salsuginibacillus kocurii]
MIQRFIELGTGYGDIYELIEILHHQNNRIQAVLQLNAQSGNSTVVSYVAILKPAQQKFQPLYICREGIPNPAYTQNERSRLIDEAVSANGLYIQELDVKHSSEFAEPQLYYQYLIGILRMSRIIDPLT